MNAEQILARLKTLAASLSKKQLLTIAGTFVGVVGLLVVWSYWLNAPDYRLLFTDMDPQAASQVVEKLKAEKISYQLTDGGRAIKVPADKLDELRVDLSAQGLPSTGRIGFAIFDRTQFGQTDFLEHVNYRRALEGELEQTIDTLREVESSRVHIAMAKDSLFTDRQQPAKASIVLKLRRRGDIGQATVNGIANMVAAAVEGLKPDGVVILDSYGRQLNQSNDDEVAGPRLDEQRQIEHDLSTRVVRLLEPVVGIGKVRVNVSATLNPSSSEETDEHWDPNSVVRSRQVTTDARGGALQGGIAGARANEPPPLPTAAQQAAATAAGTPPA
ncbi:MAG: flagellar M-ring protein FliF, partial [Acidobacteriota bacterium]|nr:flagellar M-ring protein FliF [Acidobacteriota bacterium]